MYRLRTRCQYVSGYRWMLKSQFSPPSIKSTLFGIDFDNPVGLFRWNEQKGKYTKIGNI